MKGILVCIRVGGTTGVDTGVVVVMVSSIFCIFCI